VQLLKKIIANCKLLRNFMNDKFVNKQAQEGQTCNNGDFLKIGYIPVFLHLKAKCDIFLIEF
jgi:hypothetical protein